MEHPVIIENGYVVAIHYTLTNDAGETIDSSAGRDPLQYLHGSNNIIPGLERELSGKTSGDALEVRVEPKDGYGEFDPSLIQLVERSVLEGIEDIQPGMQLEARSPEGDVRYVIVKEVTETEVTLDANAPLAGQVLHFDVKIESVREATEEELTHGHVH